MKGASQIITAVLILMIGVSIAASAYLFFSELQQSTINATEQQIKSESRKAGAELKIIGIDVNSGNITIRNTGRVELSNFIAYVDNEILETDFPDILNPGSISVITIPTKTKNITVIDQNNSAFIKFHTPGYVRGQQFKQNITGPLVKMALYSNQSFSTPHNFSIYSSSLIDTSRINLSNNVTPNQTITRNAGWTEIELSNPPYLIAGQKYWIVVFDRGYMDYSDLNPYIDGNSFTIQTSGTISYTNSIDDSFMTYVSISNATQLTNMTIKITSDYASAEAVIP